MIRPFKDWIVVEVMPFDGRGHEPTGIIVRINDETRVRKGKILRLGPDAKDLEVGETVAYLRWHEEHRPGKATVKALNELSEGGKDIAMVRLNDILFACPPETHVDVP